MTVTITAGNLAAALKATLPFASQDWSLPILGTVRIEACGELFTATATDRYAIGHARRPATGDLPALSLARADAQRLIAFIDGAGNSDHDPVTITAVDGRVVFETPSFTFRATPGEGKYPDAASIFDKTGTHAANGLAGPVAFAPELVKRVAAVASDAGGGEEPLRLFFTDPLKPVRIEVSDWLLILVMPTRPQHCETLAEVPNIPYGLAAPAPEPAGAVAA